MLTREGIPIEFGGRTRRLRFDMRALERLQLALATKARPDGMTVVELGERFAMLSTPELVTAVWVGCLSDEPTLTRDAVLGALDSEHIDEYSGAVMRALEAALPKAKKGPDEGKGDAADS